MSGDDTIRIPEDTVRSIKQYGEILSAGWLLFCWVVVFSNTYVNYTFYPHGLET